ncbi:unnamed protein product [Amoebophrya sp. A25]|nr:unnamed protein product [Amoebophrya sp. A25]|eukprot:GSA25T00012474001.1
MDMFDDSAPNSTPAPAAADPLSFMAPASPGPATDSPVPVMDAFAGMAPAAGAVGGAETMSPGGPGNEKLKEWEAAQDAKNQKKAQAELASKKKKREDAAKDLEKWYADRKARLQKKFADNRREEKDLLSIQAGKNEGQNPWERVLSLISEQAAKPESAPLQDTSRFKQLLIQLKASPIPN